MEAGVGIKRQSGERQEYFARFDILFKRIVSLFDRSVSNCFVSHFVNHTGNVFGIAISLQNKMPLKSQFGEAESERGKVFQRHRTHGVAG
jgi:hypothetical protein